MLVMRGRGSEPLADTAERVMRETAQDPAPAAVQDGAIAEKNPAAPLQEMSQAESRSRVAAKAQEPKQNAPDEAGETFTGAGVRQRSAESDAVAAVAAPSVAAPPLAATGATPTQAKAAARQLRLKTSPAIENVVVTGTATGLTAEFTERLTVIGVDSSGSARVTRYRLTSGEEITLNEALPVSNAVSAQRERRTESAREMAAPAAPPPAPLARMDSAASVPMNTISWTDPKTSRRYTLSGRVSRERLEQLRKTIEATRR